MKAGDYNNISTERLLTNELCYSIYINVPYIAAYAWKVFIVE